jgi:hypothetical protein
VLSIGILGKLALWNALKRLPAKHEAKEGLDFSNLVDRAIQQHAKVEERRIAYAERVLR